MDAQGIALFVIGLFLGLITYWGNKNLGD